MADLAKKATAHDRLLTIIDTTVKTCLIAMIMLAPLAKGAVSHGAVTALEIVALGLVVLTMVKKIRARQGWLAISLDIVVPALILVFLIGFQLVPLPGSVLRSVSPLTFNVYSRTLDGWPEYTPYRDLVTKTKGRTSESTNSIARRIGNWRTISLAPTVTRCALLKFISYLGIFLVVVLYPFAGAQAASSEQRFRRAMLIALLLSVFVSAFLALGMWSDPDGGRMTRATGTFVNPDHFACFLSMIFPVALACTLFGSNLIPHRWSMPFRTFCAVTSFVTMADLLLTGSRSGWAGAGVGMTVFFVFLRHTGRCRSCNWAPEIKQLIAVAAICVVVMVFIGTRGQEAVGQRLLETTTDATLAGRLRVWKDSFPIIADFPLFGAGLGCWSEIFPHYQSPPWPVDSYWAETHNDYLQILSETGFTGFLSIAWLFMRIFKPVLSGARNVALESTPLLAGIVGSFAAVMIEECVDFGLQLPANALTLTVLLAFGLRVVQQCELSTARTRWVPWSALPTAAVAIIAGMLAIGAMVCPSDAALYNPKNPLQATSFVLAHPALLDAHMSLLEQFGGLMTPRGFRTEVETALWLEPTNPYARDLHALVLMNKNERKHALAEVRESLVRSPALSSHSFLFADVSRLASLPADEREAIRAGLVQATTRGYQNAAQNLGDFYNAVGQPDHAAATYDAAATVESDGLQKSTFLIEAGESAIGAKDLEKAQIELEKAISASPQSAVAYEQLIDLMFRIKDSASAQKVADKAAANSMDPTAFYVQLARGEKDLGYLASAETTAVKAFDSHPSDPKAVQVLGSIYLAENRFSKAAAVFQRLCELTPKQAEAFFDLGTAEKGDYQWFAAEKALQHALVLDPKNSEYKATYNQFESKLARSKMNELPVERGASISSADINNPAIDSDAE